MNESSGGWTNPTTMRERELELEVARLQAELESAKGADAGEAASRFLALAASTVDAAMDDARREADELVAEVTADAEVRRDEATRLAAEAESRAETMRAEAENHEAIVTAAQQTAGQIRADAETEAANLVATERARVVEEIESLSEVREALEGEREALESYHDQLRRRVQELAESMVNFMTTEPPLAAGTGLEELVAPRPDSEEFSAPVAEFAAIEDPASAENPAVTVAEVADHEIPVDEIADDETAVDEIVVDETAESEAPVAEYNPFEETPAEPIDVDTFGGVPVFGDEVEGAEVESHDVFDEAPPVPHVPSSGGLFSRATEEEVTSERGGLFGTHGFRLVQQTNAEELAEALGHEGEADAAFESFLAGDSEADPSRDWLLRNDMA